MELLVTFTTEILMNLYGMADTSCVSRPNLAFTTCRNMSETSRDHPSAGVATLLDQPSVGIVASPQLPCMTHQPQLPHPTTRPSLPRQSFPALRGEVTINVKHSHTCMTYHLFHSYSWNCVLLMRSEHVHQLPYVRTIDFSFMSCITVHKSVNIDQGHACSSMQYMCMRIWHGSKLWHP